MNKNGQFWFLLVFPLTMLLVAGCLALRPSRPPEQSSALKRMSRTPWQTGTPEPLFAPLTHTCPGKQVGEQGGVAYGINVFLFSTDVERVLTLTDIAGFGWIRQQIHWRDLEGEAGVFVWRPLDQVVSAARAHNLKVMLSVVRSPTWATAGGHTGLPDDPAHLARFLERAARRYRGRVSAYEIWNEPNLSHECGGTPCDPAAYLATLQASYQAIKAVDPCALVVAAPLAATNDPDPTVAAEDIPFYETLYQLDNGAFLRAADAIAIHPGAGPHPPGATWPANALDQSHHYFRHIERIRSLMLHYGDPRPVWMTEVGWTVEQAEGAPQPVSEQEQADYLVDMLWYVRQRYPWIAGVLVWNLNFSVIAPPGDEKTTYSLLAPDWTIRPAFRSLQHNIPPLRDIDRPPLITEMAGRATHRFAWVFPARGAIRTRPLRTPSGSLYVTSDPATLYALTASGRLQWAHNASGIVRSAPIRAADGTLYLADSNSLITALHSSGAVLWQTRLRSPARGSPLVQGEHLYVVTNVGELHAFDTDDGERAWSYDLGEETTPLAWSSDGALLVGTASGDVLKLTTDRETRWRTRVPADDGDGLWLAPVPDGAGGCSIVTARGQVVALDATGAMRWRAAPDSPVVSPLLVSDSGGERVGKRGSEKGMVYGTTHEGDLLALAAAGGAERWRYATGSRLQAPPVRGPDGTLYLGTGDGRLLAISPEGTLLWQAHLGGAVEAPPIVAPDGTLYVATTGGRLYAFAPLFPRQ